MFCYLRKSAEGWAVTVAVSFGWCIMLFNINLIIIINIIFHIFSNIFIIVGTKRIEEKLKAPVCWETKWPTTKPNQLLLQNLRGTKLLGPQDGFPPVRYGMVAFIWRVCLCLCVFFFLGGWRCQFYFFSLLVGGMHEFVPNFKTIIDFFFPEK